ncbi:MAG: hypothetical protein V8T87_07355 [Victivallales bacterium]
MRKLRLAESDWLLIITRSAPVLSKTMSRNQTSGNGGFLLRTAQDYPDAPRRNEYLEKSTSFLLNGISHPMDAAW